MSTLSKLATCPVCETEEAITVELEYEPGEMYGTDADGNRGVWHEGFYYATDDDLTCANGCALTYEQTEKIKKDAAEYQSENQFDYDGPEHDDD